MMPPLGGIAGSPVTVPVITGIPSDSIEEPAHNSAPASTDASTRCSRLSSATLIRKGSVNTPIAPLPSNLFPITNSKAGFDLLDVSEKKKTVELTRRRSYTSPASILTSLMNENQVKQEILLAGFGEDLSGAEQNAVRDGVAKLRRYGGFQPLPKIAETGLGRGSQLNPSSDSLMKPQCAKKASMEEIRLHESTDVTPEMPGEHSFDQIREVRYLEILKRVS